MKKWLLFLLLALVSPALAQQQDQKILTSNLNVAAVAYTYYLYTDPLKPPAGASIAAVANTTAITSGTSGAFTGMAVADLLSFIDSSGTVTNSRIVTWTNANSIVVDANVTLAAGTSFTWRQRTGGTAVGSGSFGISNYRKCTITAELPTFTAASIEMRIEGRIPGGGWTEVFTQSWTALLAIGQAFQIVECGTGAFTDLRVGTKVTTDGGAQDLTIKFNGVR